MKETSREPLEERLYLSVPHMGGSELDYVREAFDSNWLSTVGPHLTALEKEMEGLVGCPAAALSSGTAGLHLALRLVGVGLDDEVVTPTLSFAASANAIRYLGGIPVFVDSDRATWNMDPELLASFLKKRAAANRLPKAVMVVHLFGQPAAMREIQQLCRQYDLPVIEDAAESLGALYEGEHPGALADVGVYSFNGNKMITGTTGGMLVSPHADWVTRARKWSSQALDPDPQGVSNYVHSELGYSYGMSNVVAGIVRGQLEVLEKRVAQRRRVFERYVRGLEGLPAWQPQPEARACRHSRWLSCFELDESRSGVVAYDVIRFLASLNVESRPVWRPMHLQPLYQRCEIIGGKVAEHLNQNAICLPSSSSISEKSQSFVVDSVVEASERHASSALQS